MASCHRRAVLPGSRPGRYAPRSSARQNFLPAAKRNLQKERYTTVLMGSAVIYGVVRAVELWLTNRLLFAVSVFVALVTLIGALMQSVNADDFEFKWMLWYSIPMGLLVLGGVLGNNELQDVLLSKAGVQPPPHVLPGFSSDYEHAAVGHFASMLFPIAAALFAKLVQFGLDIWNTAKGRKDDA